MNIETMKKNSVEASADIVAVSVDALIQVLGGSLPVASWILGFTKVFQSFRDIHLYNKIERLINGADAVKPEWRKKLIENESERNKILETTVLILDDIRQKEKVDLLRYILLAKIDGILSYHEFADYCEILDSMLLSDIRLFNKIYHNPSEDFFNNSDIVLRLSSRALLKLPTPNIYNQDDGGWGIDFSNNEKYNNDEYYTELGKNFLTCYTLNTQTDKVCILVIIY
jgi:hypothetical protein